MSSGQKDGPVNYKSTTKAIEKLMINGLLEYLETGKFQSSSPNAFVTCYANVQTMADEGDEGCKALFDYYKAKISKYIKKVNETISDCAGEKLVNEFIKYLSKINILCYWMRNMFTYLDRYYTKAKTLKTLDYNAMDIFRKELFDNVKSKIFRELEKMILDDRNGNLESREKIKIILDFVDNADFPDPKIEKENNKIFWTQREKGKEDKKNGHCYANEWFEKYGKVDTEDFIKKKARVDIENMSAPEYIESSLKYLREENERKSLYFNKLFHKEIDRINSDHLVKQNAEKLANKETGFEHMFKTNQLKQLKDAFDLLKSNPESLKCLTDKLEPYIRNRGTQLYENKEIMKDPNKIVPELIKLKKEMDDLVLECFGNENTFIDAKNKGFSRFMSKDIFAKQLSNYTDYCMKIGFKSKSNQEIDASLNEIIGLFKCLNNKLTFGIDANKKMSDRLIKNRTISLYAERELISKLKQEAGVTYVNKMTEMMSDLDKTKQELDIYKGYGHKGSPGGIKFDVKVISQSSWEISNKVMEKGQLPPCLNNCIKDFQDFYLKRHSSQELKWCYGLSKMDIQYLTLSRKYISTSTLIQYLILLQLEKFGKMTIGQLAESIGYNVPTVIDDIGGLVYNPSFNKGGNKDKGLIKGTWDGNTKEFRENDEIEFNPGFNSNAVKFSTVPMLFKKSVAQTQKNELEEAQIVKKEQDFILQATLTRIMKSRIGTKTPHSWLINEARKQIDHFVAQPQQIKENIEKLIEKSIMKRSEGDSSLYEYIS